MMVISAIDTFRRSTEEGPLYMWVSSSLRMAEEFKKTVDESDLDLEACHWIMARSFDSIIRICRRFAIIDVSFKHFSRLFEEVRGLFEF